MTRFSLRTRLIVGLIAVVAVGLGIAEVVTYYSVRSFMLERVDEQVQAAQGPAVARLFVEDSFREFIRRPSGSGAGNLGLPADPVTGEAEPATAGVPPQSGPSPPQRDERIISARGAPQNFTANLPPGTYAEVRFATGEPRATSFGFEDTYPVPDLPAETPSGTRVLTVQGIGSSEDFRVRISPAPDGQATLFVAVPLTEFD